MSNNFTDERVAIETTFSAAFIKDKANPADASVPFLPVQYENQPFVQPVGSPWARLSITGGTDTGMDVGGDYGREIGILYLQVFVPEGGGVEPFNTSAALFASIFNLQTFNITNGYIVFKRSSRIAVGKDEATGMFQRNCSIEFRRDTFAS